MKEDEILRPDGSTGIYGVVEKKDFAVIAAIEGDSIYMVEQFRYPVQERFWELPQGSWEDCDVEPEVLARAELKEETGIIAKKNDPYWALFCGIRILQPGLPCFCGYRTGRK